MKKVQKGFTLVELIVVITILAILGTIAFISLQGYSQDAKNSKVSSDIRTLASAIETRLTESAISIHDLVGTSLSDGMGNHIVTDGSQNLTFAGSGSSMSGATYSVGTIAFTTLGQNGEDFVDPNGNEYVIGTLTKTDGDNSYVMYQIVGEAGGADTRSTVVKGNYLFDASVTTDVTGLVSASGATANTPETSGLTNDLSISGAGNSIYE